MAYREVRKVQVYSRQLVVGIPRRLCRALGIARGDFLEVYSDESGSFSCRLVVKEAGVDGKRHRPSGRVHPAA